MIELSNICKTYKDKKKKKETKALKSINYKFGDTGLYFVTGKSGSGKSTLLSILSGIDFNFEGDLFIDNKSIKDFSKNDINYYRSSYLGFIFQDYNLIPELDAYDNVKLGLDVSNNDNEEDIHKIFKKLDIEELETRELSELSGGEKQRVAIARCLVKKPKVILADEPTGALDPINSRIIMDTLYDLSKEYLVIIVTHNTNYLDDYESNKLYLDHGVLTTNDLLEVSAKEEYKSQKYKGLSNKIKFKLGFEILLHKKITLILSLFFIILSLICVSISISGINYDTNYSVYQELKKNKDYAVARYTTDNQSFTYTPKSIENDLKKYNQNYVYAHDLRCMGIEDDSYTIVDYYLNDTNNNMACSKFRAFEYSDNAIDLFELKIINGNAPKNDNEILITDITCEYFISCEYSYGDVSKNITTYDDMIGLNLFGFKISGVVSTNKSKFYKDIYNNIYIEDTNITVMNETLAIDSGCANAIFTKKKIHSSLPIYFVMSSRYVDYLDYYNDVDMITDSLEDVYYFDGCDSNSNGIIVSADFISKYRFGLTYEEKIQEDFARVRGSVSADYTDEEIMEIVKKYFNDDISKLYSSIKFKVSDYKSSSQGSSISFDTIQNIIGISYAASSKSMYVNLEKFEGLSEISDYTNAVAIYSSLKNINKKYLNELIDNLESFLNDVYNEPAICLENARAYKIICYEDIFLVLKIIFGSLAIMFFAISLFIMYKYINDSISYKEKDIGVLKSIGVSERDIIGIFNIQNLFIMSISLITSIIIQYLGVYGVNKIMSRIFEMNSYVESYRVLLYNYFAIIFISLIIPIIATMYPILRIAHKNPKDVLNNN